MANPYMNVDAAKLKKAARALAKRIEDLEKENFRARFNRDYDLARKTSDTIIENHKTLRQMRDAQTLRGL